MNNSHEAANEANIRYIETAVERYSKMLFRICLMILCNVEDAEDAVQECFLRYMTKAPQFTSFEHEKAWLIRVATNICKNMNRFRFSHPTVQLDEIAGIGVDSADGEVLEAIMSLPARYKIVMDLYYVEGYRVNEIARIIGVSEAAVRKRMQHAREMIKNEIEWGGDGDK